MVSAKFLEVYEQAGAIKSGPSNDEQLNLYSLNKVAREIDFSKADKPGMFDLKGKAKYAAWKKKVDDGLSAEDAETQYIELGEKLIAAHSQKKEEKKEEDKDDK